MTVTERRIFVMSDGVQLVGDVGGDPAGPTIVLMHGGGQTRNSWSGATKALIAAGYHVINYDARGHGESEWSPIGDYNLKLRAHDLEAVTAGLTGPVAWVGASLGGATALHGIGERIVPTANVIVLVDIVPRPDPVGTGRINAFMRANPDGFASLEQAADAIAAYNPHRPRPRDVSGLAKNLREREDGRLYWHWDPRMLEGENIPDQMILGDRMSGYARQIRVPTLLVRGLSSDVVSEAGVSAFLSDLPTLEIFDVSGAGHMVAGDRNDAFNAGVIDFLARQMPAR
jgi:pimeloyl-ACP methyl ester carboxylesterase